MVVRIYDQLPWFLKPGKVYFNKNRELSLAQPVLPQDRVGQIHPRRPAVDLGPRRHPRASIGRGQTYSRRAHLASCRPGRTPSSSTPRSCPPSPTHRTRWSSTRRPRSLPATGGTSTGSPAVRARAASRTSSSPGRPSRRSYSLPAPVDWAPSASTLAHAAKCERDSPKWFGGRTVTLDPRAAVLVRDHPPLLREEGPALQVPQGVSGRRPRVLPVRRPLGLHARTAGTDRPRREPAPAQGRLGGRARDARSRSSGATASRRATPPTCSPSASCRRSRRMPRSRSARSRTTTNPVPPGYGFRRLDKAQLAQLPNLRQTRARASGSTRGCAATAAT